MVVKLPEISRSFKPWTQTKISELKAVIASQNVGSDHMPRQLESAAFMIEVALSRCAKSSLDLMLVRAH
jgi:hypothetical protein